MSSSLKDPSYILKLLSSNSEVDNIKGYSAFLIRTHWFNGAKPNDLKKVACKQLNVKSRNVLASFRKVEPALLWSSQDGLQVSKLRMVEAADNYGKLRSNNLPPVILWNFYDSQSIRLVIHDGHHRSYYSHRIGERVPAIVLEPLGNYVEMEQKLKYAFQIRKRVIDLPVSRTKYTSLFNK